MQTAVTPLFITQFVQHQNNNGRYITGDLISTEQLYLGYIKNYIAVRQEDLYKNKQKKKIR